MVPAKHKLDMSDPSPSFAAPLFADAQRLSRKGLHVSSAKMLSD
jgi:hypothetical protein